MIMTAPAGAFIDHTKKKRMIVIVTGICSVWPVQALDDIGAGLQSVAVPGLVACLLNGTGRVNVGQGAGMTMQGVGASLSSTVGGWLAQAFGYHIAFYILGSFALVSVGLWLRFGGILRPACAGTSNRPMEDKE